MIYLVEIIFPSGKREMNYVLIFGRTVLFAFLTYRHPESSIQGPHPSSTSLVATLLQNSSSCSTKTMVGLHSKISDSI